MWSVCPSAGSGRKSWVRLGSNVAPLRTEVKAACCCAPSVLVWNSSRVSTLSYTLELWEHTSGSEGKKIPLSATCMEGDEGDDAVLTGCWSGSVVKCSVVTVSSCELASIVMKHASVGSDLLCS